MRKYPRISKLMVLQSAAGFYIGRVEYITEDESEPYSRESNYFRTEEAANRALFDNDYIKNFY